MTNDIVTRLREIADNYKNGHRSFVYSDYETICQAWSEIELLWADRAEQNEVLRTQAIEILEGWKRDGVEFPTHPTPVEWTETKYELERLRGALRRWRVRNCSDEQCSEEITCEDCKGDRR